MTVVGAYFFLFCLQNATNESEERSIMPRLLIDRSASFAWLQSNLRFLGRVQYLRDVFSLRNVVEARFKHQCQIKGKEKSALARRM